MQKKLYLIHTLKQYIIILKEKLTHQQIKKGGAFLFKEKRIMGIFGYIIYVLVSFIVEFEIKVQGFTFVLNKLKIPVAILFVGLYLTVLPGYLVLLLFVIALMYLQSKYLLYFIGLISFISLIVTLTI